MYKSLIVLFSLALSLPIYSKENIVMHVMDEASKPLTYGDVFVKQMAFYH